MEMIQINKTAISGETINTVNARELHTILGVKTQYSIWIQKRIAEYGFQDGLDFTRVVLPAGQQLATNGSGSLNGVLDNNLKKLALQSTGYESFGQTGRTEYAVSIHMAKELSMVERNEKGKEARKYFIEQEKKLKQMEKVTEISLLEDPVALRNMLLGYTEKVVKLEQAVKSQEVVIHTKNNIIQQQAPAVAFHNTVAAHEDLWYSLEESAKLLNVGRTTLSRFLKDNGYMTQTRFPLQRYIDSKIMGVKIDQYKEPVGYGQFVEHAPTAKPFLTGKGLTVIGDKLRKAGM